MSTQVEEHINGRFQLVKKIGSGAYGHVWKIIDRQTRKVKALKKNFDAFNNSTDAQRTYRQIMFLTQLSHPNIIRLEQVIRAQNDKDIYIVFEHMDIDLYTLIRQNILVEKHKKFILYQIAKSMFYLHSAGLIHRDIKPSNVLVNQSCQAKICDFGLVRSIDDKEESKEILTQYIATRWYRAPQLLLDWRYYSKGIDMWSMGCLLAEMQRGKPLFAGTSTTNQLQRVLMWTGPPSAEDVKSLKLKNGKQTLRLFARIKQIPHQQMVPGASQQCLDLIRKCLQFNPEKRCTILDFLKHPYLTEFYNKKQLLVSHDKIKVPIDDNVRLNLKEYRASIYDEIKKKSRAEVSGGTLYRIKNTFRKNSKRKQSEEDRDKTVLLKEDSKQKKKVVVRNRKLKTIQKQWDPITKKASLVREQTKYLNTKFGQEWIRKKRSATQSSTKKNRMLTSPAQVKYRFY